MLWLLLPLMAGIYVATLAGGALLYFGTLFLLATLALFLLRKVWCIYPIIFAFGAIITSLSLPHDELMERRDVRFVVDLREDHTARIISIEADDGLFNSCNHKVLVRGAEQLLPSVAVVQGSIRPFAEPLNPYLRSMRRRGVQGYIIIDTLLAEPAATRSSLSAQLNDWAMERLERLELRPTAFAVAAAEGLAHREGLSDQVISNYNHSGTAHLLALSGLHFGVVMLIIYIFTFPLPLLRNGHIAADLLAIVAIWLFALMAGMGQSVMRAAWMFSLLRLLSMVSRQYSSLNSLFVAAAMILCFDPLACFDVGFSLSFIAVLTILLVGVPLVRRVRCGSRVLDIVVHAIIIGTVASIAVSPLISNVFGYFSLLGPLATLPLLPLLTITVAATLLWVLFPLEPLSPLFWWVIEVATTLQNYLVEWFASWGVGLINYRISDLGLCASYLFILIFSILLRSRLLRDKSDEPTMQDLNL